MEGPSHCVVRGETSALPVREALRHRFQSSCTLPPTESQTTFWPDCQMVALELQYEFWHKRGKLHVSAGWTVVPSRWLTTYPIALTWHRRTSTCSPKWKIVPGVAFSSRWCLRHCEGRLGCTGRNFCQGDWSTAASLEQVRTHHCANSVLLRLWTFQYPLELWFCMYKPFISFIVGV